MPERVLREVRARNIRYVLITLSLLAVPLVAASLFRALHIGWQPVQVLYLTAALILWSTSLLFQQLGEDWSGRILVLLGAAVCVAGVLQFGLVAAALPILISLPLLVMLLFGSVSALASLLLVVLLLVCAAQLAVQGRLPLILSPETAQASISHWAMYIASTVLMSVTLIAGIYSTLFTVRESVSRLTEERDKFEEQSHRLRQKLAIAEESAQSLRWRFEQALDVGRDGHWLYAPDSDEMWWSDGLFTLLELPPQLVSPTLSTLKHHLVEADAQRFQDCLDRCLREGEDFTIGCWMTSAEDREAHFLRLDGARRQRPSGEPIVFGLVRDETADEQNRSTLREQQERLEEIIEATRVGTWEWNIETGATRFNDRWAQMLGYALEDLQPTTIDTSVSLGHPDDIRESSRRLEQHFRGECDYYECEVRLRHCNGQWVWVLDRGRVVEWSADGRPIRMAGTHSDISTAKALQLELETQKRLLDELGRIACIGGWSYSEETQRLDWTAETRRLHDVPDDFRPTIESAIEFYHPDDRPLIERAVRQGLENGTPWDLQLRIITSRGEERRVRAVGEVTHHERGAMRLAGTFQLVDYTLMDPSAFSTLPEA